MEFNANEKVMINVPTNVPGVMHADKLRKFNRKVATIVAVCGDHCRLNVDDGKYEWPFSVLGKIVPYGGKEIKMEFDIRQTKNYFEVYFEDMFLSCADTHEEAEEDIEYMKKEISEVGFDTWRSDLYARYRKLAALKN